jgi:hypothetical protein
VDGAFAAVWDAVIGVVTPEQIAKAETAFDTICEAVSDSYADRMSDVAASTASEAMGTEHEEAARGLAMIRESLRWRAERGSWEHGQGAELAEVQRVTTAAAEDAARLLHQLFTASQSWGALNKWKGGKLAR